jgi:hypothetical protein
MAIDVNTGLPSDDLCARDVPLLILLQRVSMALLPVARTYTQTNATTINVARYHAAYASLENLPQFPPPSTKNGVSGNGNGNSAMPTSASTATFSDLDKAASLFGVGLGLGLGNVSSADDTSTQSRLLAPLKGPEDYVLTYVLAEALVRMVYWGSRGVVRPRTGTVAYTYGQDTSSASNHYGHGDAYAQRSRARTLSDTATDDQAADGMAAKLVVDLSLDDDAIDACLLTQCDAVLRGLLEGQAGLNPKGKGLGGGGSDSGKGGLGGMPGHHRASSLGLDKILKAAADDGESDDMKEPEQTGEYTGKRASQPVDAEELTCSNYADPLASRLATYNQSIFQHSLICSLFLAFLFPLPPSCHLLSGEIATSKGRIGGVAVAQCLVSGSQSQLYEMLVVSSTEEATFHNTLQTAGIISSTGTITFRY